MGSPAGLASKNSFFLNGLENPTGGAPQTLKVDNGSEFISKAMGRSAYEHGPGLDSSRPGTPTDSATIERFNGRFRQACLNEHGCLSLEDVGQLRHSPSIPAAGALATHTAATVLPGLSSRCEPSPSRGRCASTAEGVQAAAA
ncbi:hypothetical protein CVV70_23335 [Ralstonia solanacearum]|nr:hypothetical protein CCY86_13130 [Ralstonia solanacearum]NUU73646.1 DDE-type integrase/transposase/recombinase [Ralstonia solanacearum]PNQ30030.1 hypothetical protein CVS51_20470 [Ralstonia solanacearum]PNQ31523.1 hypothetical protein CVV71_23360 [Ralstonia solanacearum]PNQ36364.1 hypothetical protein CVT22_22355 [Ralstonia solanacearum]